MNAEEGRSTRNGTTLMSRCGTEVDHFDVDLLTEYLLLEDGNATSSAAAWDFSAESSNQTVLPSVSPGTSEDGAFPPVADLPMLQEEGASMAKESLPQLTTKTPVSTTVPTVPTWVPCQQAKRQRVQAPSVLPTMLISGSVPKICGQRVLQAPQDMLQHVQCLKKRKAQAKLDRRRERNRIMAQRTRRRKKVFFEHIQKEAVDLMRENMRLKSLIRANFSGEESKAILSGCDAMADPTFCFGSNCFPDNPIVFVSDAFLEITGYSRDQVIGRNCRFLQGSDTSNEKVDKIRKALASGNEVSVTLLNYAADGTPFWNMLHISPLRDADNNIVQYISVAVKVDEPLPDDPEHDRPLSLKERKPSATVAPEATQKTSVFPRWLTMIPSPTLASRSETETDTSFSNFNLESCIQKSNAIINEPNFHDKSMGVSHAYFRTTG